MKTEVNREIKETNWKNKELKKLTERLNKETNSLKIEDSWENK
jgi:hypothetical protein